MTVRRHADRFFDAAPTTVARAVRTVLARRPPYTRATEIEKNTLFRVNIRSRWSVVSTSMIIQLMTSFGGSEVVVESKSRYLILGDVFGCCNRTIRNFMNDLQTEVKNRRA